MKVLPFDCDEAAIRGVVVEWNELMAQGNFEAALGLLHPSIWDPQSHEWWTPDILEKHVTYRGSIVPVDQHRSKVTSFYEAKPREWEPEFEVSRGPWAQDENLYDGMVHYDLPLDGYWSDLTARFQIRRVSGGIALELEDIHYL